MKLRPLRFWLVNSSILNALLKLKHATASRLRRFSGRRWLTRLLLALFTAFFIAWDFNLPAGVQLAQPFARATDKGALPLSRPAKIVQSQPDAQLLVERGRRLYEAKQFSEAVTVLQQAAEAFQARTDKLGQAIALSNLSLAFQQLGQWDNAEAAIRNAIAGLRPASLTLHAQSLNLLNNSKFSDPDSARVLAQILDIQGHLQLELGRTQDALDSWKQAANTYERVGDEVGRIRSSINQAQAEQALGLDRQAKITLEQLFPSLENQPDSPIKVTALRSLGDVLQLVGDLEQSLKVLQQSRDMAQRLQSAPEIAAALLSLGNTERVLGNRTRSSSAAALTQQSAASEEKSAPLHCIGKPNSDDALKHYQQAVRYYQESAAASDSPLIQIQAQLNQLSVLLELQNGSDAQNLWPSIQLALTQIPPSQAAILARINLAQSLMCLKQTTAADVPSWRDIAEGLATASQQAKSFGDKRSEAYALGVLGGVYLESQNEFSDLTYARKLTEQALVLAEEIQAADISYLWQWQLGYLLRTKGDIQGAIAFYTEAVNTLESLRSDLVTLNPDVQFSFRDNVEPVYRQFVDLLLQPLGDSEEEESPHIAKGEVSQENLKLARKAIEALQVTELENFFQEACLQRQPQQIDEVVDKTDPTAAAIYPIILKDRLEIILKLPAQPELRHYTTYKSQNEVESTLGKLQQYLREPDRINDVKRLSQQVYSWLIEPLKADLKAKAVKTLVFVLDGYLRNIPMAVLYDETQKQYLVENYAIALVPGLQLIDPKRLQRTHLDALIGGVSEKRKLEGREFAPLKNVELELERIESVISESEQLFNQTFTETNLQKEINSASFSVVHMATHGKFSSNAEETFILTWEQLLKAKDLDRLLRIRGGKAGAIELLVLSACQTAVGDKRAALGLAGIAVRAGARSTLATLWSVNDRSTAEFMSQFYQELVNTTLTKAEALRRAQLALLGSYETPYFWAPYVLVGNWL